MKRGLAGVSLITMSVLYGILAIIIIPICYYLGVSILFTILVLIAAIMLQFLISPFLTDISMKWFYGARFDMEMPAYLKDFITKVCQEHNMKYPRIGYINDGAPNAFTYGHTKNDARIVLTRGTFELLSEDEVKAVVGHELGHAVHYDMALMTIAQLVPLILYAVYEMFAEHVDTSDDDDNSKLAAIGYVAYILYIICQYIILWLSRVREYYADSFSAEELKNPNLLASALVKIGYGLSASTSRDGKISVSSKNTLGIFDSRTSKTLIVSSYNNGEVSKDNIKNAMKWEMWNVWAKWYELNSTHPLISKRLKALSEMSSKYGMEPYIKFDLQKTESYVDDFLVEILIKYLPLTVFIVSISFVLFFEEKIGNYGLAAFGGVLLLTALSAFIPLRRKYPNSNYKETTVANLLGEVKVSGVTAIPCVLSGEIIGRGNPGCIFNEDFVIRDSTGIVFLDYNQPVHIINKIFALFKSSQYFNKNIIVKGWYRRSPVPYVEINSMIIDGKTKKCYTYLFSKIFTWLLAVAGLAMIYFGIFN